MEFTLDELDKLIRGQINSDLHSMGFHASDITDELQTSFVPSYLEGMMAQQEAIQQAELRRASAAEGPKFRAAQLALVEKIEKRRSMIRSLQGRYSRNIG